MAVATAADFAATLRRLPLLTPEQTSQLPALAQRFPDSKALGGELIRRGWLTPYQTNQLLQAGGQGLVLGSYVLLERLGEGGMGQVFKARHQHLDRVVALKLIHKERLDEPKAVQRFHREIRSAAALNHPNIVLAFDADQSGTTHFLTMEYVAGTDLSRRVREHGPLPIADACNYIRQAALGLQHAHEKGMVHRDIKPANLLLDGKGTVKILDMGLARLARKEESGDSSGSLTQEGLVMGTLDYIAPEQAMDSHTVDIRADLYSLGCTFYFLLTGRVPFPGGDDLGKLIKHKLEEPPPIKKLRPDVPPNVAAVVRKLMAKDPKQRFQTPAELAALLTPGTVRMATAVPMNSAARSAADTVSLEATPRIPRARRRRFPYVVLAAAACVALLLSLLLLSPFGRSPPSAAMTAAATTPPTSAAGPTKFFVNALEMKFARVPRGQFLMGGSGGKASTRVQTIAQDFYLGVDELTQEEWVKVMETNPSYYSRNGAGRLKVKDVPDAELKRFPVEQVTWDDIQQFLARLNQQTKEDGWVYRLPTEAEWEYACRGGPSCPPANAGFDYYFEMPTNQLAPDLANYRFDRGVNRTCKVGSYAANPLGLHDMHGNVWELCDDEHKTVEGPRHACRGGGWIHEAGRCRTTDRALIALTYSRNDLGFRVARVPVGKESK